MKFYSLLIVLFVAFSGLAGCSAANPPQASSTPETKVASAKTESASYEAGAFQVYSRAAYEKALADGKTVMLDFHANWCSICVSNSPIIEEAFQKLNDPNVVGFKVNYDTEEALKDQFGVRSQATLLLIRDRSEVRRVVGPQTVTSVTALLQS